MLLFQANGGIEEVTRITVTDDHFRTGRRVDAILVQDLRRW